MAVTYLVNEASALKNTIGFCARSEKLTCAERCQPYHHLHLSVDTRQVYNALNRLTAASYSTGEQFAYRYDAVGNRAVVTETTPISGTVVTTYTFDAANRLTDRQMNNGWTYTYTWSARGQMLAEWIQGYAVRTFEYDAAGRMNEATVFTQTTHFRYNGDGARVAVEVVGQGTTTYTIDYAGGYRVLAEETLTETVSYLYGHDCLGEQRDGEWLYYLTDAGGYSASARYVRQGADAQGKVKSTWLFDPDGLVIEGPQGLVSHLVCGGVYDWSTGLIFKGNRYFDPSLGVWLSLAPLVVLQGWKRRKRRHWSLWCGVLLLAVGASSTLTGCSPTSTIVPALPPTVTQTVSTQVCTQIPTETPSPTHTPSSTPTWTVTWTPFPTLMPTYTPTPVLPTVTPQPKPDVILTPREYVEQYRDLSGLAYTQEWTTGMLSLADLENSQLPERALLAMVALSESTGHTEGMEAVMWIVRTRAKFTGTAMRAQILNGQFSAFKWLHQGGTAIKEFKYSFDPKGRDAERRRVGLDTPTLGWYETAYSLAGIVIAQPYEQMPQKLRRLDSFVSKDHANRNPDSYAHYKREIGGNVFGDDWPADNQFWNEYEKNHS